MSRAKPVDNSAAVSLFPFLAVLLCTMGALLVVLIGMTRSARDAALRRAEADQPPPVAAVDPDAQKEINEVKNFVSRLDQVRNEALQKLREDQQRLSHLEDHMRRLQDQLEKLQVGAAELEGLEGEHYDDREQAEREVQRLRQLIASTRETIEALQQEQYAKKRSYALVPYEGPHGTTRRPIYVECRDGELILQPEGVRITRDDLRPPLGTGNPLASALRAARDYFIQLHPEDGLNRDTEPYPLIVVRPSGTAIYGIAQRAIRSSDFQFGYELVEEDWELKYPAADPQLAIIEQRAIEQARIRQYALAAAAPRAYRNPGLAAAGRFDEFGGGEGFDGWEEGDSPEAGSGGLPGTGSGFGESTEQNEPGDHAGLGSGGGAGGSPNGEAAEHSHHDGPGVRGNGAVAANAADNSDAEASGDGANGDSSQATGSASAVAGGMNQRADGAAGGASSTANSGDPASATPSVVQLHSGDQHQEAELSATRGTDWALKHKKSRAVPVRRTIQVIVRNEHLAILSDDVRPNAPALAAKTIPLERDTVESIDEFVAAVQYQIEGWGIAGDGLYWRPVLSLHVGPDGRRRAQDLARLLKNSGLELQPAATANHNPGGKPRATRSR